MKDQIAYFKPIQEFNGCDYWIQKKEIGLMMFVLDLIFTQKTPFCAIFSIVVSNFVGEAEFFL